MDNILFISLFAFVTTANVVDSTLFIGKNFFAKWTRVSWYFEVLGLDMIHDFTFGNGHYFAHESCCTFYASHGFVRPVIQHPLAAPCSSLFLTWLKSFIKLCKDDANSMPDLKMYSTSGFVKTTDFYFYFVLLCDICTHGHL